MRVRTAVALMCLVNLWVHSCLQGADSGPAAGTEVTGFKAFAVIGEATGESLDYAVLRAGKPTLFCFVTRERWSRSTARLLKKLDMEIAAAAPEGGLVVIWLTDDVAAGKEYLPVAQRALQLSRTSMAVYEENAAGPPEWGINRDVDLTVVATSGGKVLQSAALTGPNDTQAAEVLALLK